jgi:phage/plasmid primase-like uncharacterized protein
MEDEDFLDEPTLFDEKCPVCGGRDTVGWVDDLGNQRWSCEDCNILWDVQISVQAA